MKYAALVVLIGCGSSTPKPAPEVPDTATPTPIAAAPVAAPIDAAVPPSTERSDGAELDRIPAATGSLTERNAEITCVVDHDERTYKLAVDSKIEAIYRITDTGDDEEHYLIRVVDPVQITIDQDQPVVRKDPPARSIMLALPAGVTVDLAKGQHVMISIEQQDTVGKAFIKDDKGLVLAIDPPADILPYSTGKKMRVDRFEVTVKLEGKQLRSFYWTSQTVNGASYFMYGAGREMALLRKP
ncbi:MAG: hypothetical protein QM831_34715 [Kofleriaceae bacterium]